MVPDTEDGTMANLARAVPLIAAILAPLITLLDIPALTQRWYYVNGLPTDDPVESIVLSAVSLGLCFVGNALLVLRFSSNAPSVRAVVVEAPLVCFWIKTAVEVANLAVYARANSRPDNYVLGQAFWCAIFSCGLSGIVSVLLMVHFVVQRRQRSKDSIKHRVDGRHFLLSVTAFVAVIALHALAFSEIEDYPYWDGVFAAIVTCTTIGFGVMAPRHTSTKILLFVFFAVDVALLGNMISMIVGYIGESKVRRHKIRMQGLFMSRHGRSIDEQKEWGLVEELDFLEDMQQRERNASQIYDLIVSLTTFIIFSVVGAAVFQQSEKDWTFGDALYFVLVFSFTIGFGDLSPTSPLSRVFFVLYALIAVPVVASFATQTVTTVVEQFSKKSLSAAHRTRKKHLRRGPNANPADEEEAEAQDEEDELKPHHYYIWGKWNALEKDSKDQAQRSAEQRRQDQTKLADEVLDLACQLESLSRCMLMSALGSGKARNLLRADRHIQRRDIKAAGEGDKMTELWEKEDQFINNSPDDLIGSINEYRQTFAHLLACGAKLKQLEGVNRKAFLRVRLEGEDQEDKGEKGKKNLLRDAGAETDSNDASSSHTRAEEEMEMMDEMGSIDVQNEDGDAVKVDVKDKKERVKAKHERAEKREK